MQTLLWVLLCISIHAVVTSTFDYVIVGAGTAGSIVADRLSKLPNITVLVIEAGSNQTDNPMVYDPYQAFDQPASLRWNYKTEPENGRVFDISLGKMFGGSSSANAAAYERSPKETWNEWAHVVNDQRWNYDTCLQYFKLAENNSLQNKHYHGHKGSWEVLSCPQVAINFTSVWRDTASELRYPFSSDLSGEQQIGFSFEQVTMKNGKRVSSATAFLNPASTRSNLRVWSNSIVSTILFHNKTAVGVMVEKNGIATPVYARKEVILSAGALMSPFILLRSGIGNFDQLFGIEPFHELKGVGQHLIDNGVIISSFSSQNMPSLRGPYCPKRPAALISTDHKIKPNFLFGFRNDDKPNEITAIIFSSDLGSKGFVSLYNASSSVPKIHLGLSASELTEKMVEGLRFVNHVFSSKTMTNAVGPFTSISPSPGQDLLQFVKQHIIPSQHFGGTCKMGKPNDPMAVVDTEFRVLGLQSLRVIDASVMPILLESGTYASTVMLGERGASFIKALL
jgi:choline dehydrogenase